MSVCFSLSRRKKNTHNAMVFEVRQKTTYCSRRNWKQTLVRFVHSQKRGGEEYICFSYPDTFSGKNNPKTSEWNLPISDSICHVWYFAFLHVDMQWTQQEIITWALEKNALRTTVLTCPLFMCPLILQCLFLLFLSKSSVFFPPFISSAFAIFFWFFYFL